MKLSFFRVVFALLIFLCIFGSYVFADTTPSAISEPVEIFSDDSLPSNITLVINNPDNSAQFDALQNSIDALGADNSLQSSSFSGFEDGGMVLLSTSISTERISASDANGFKAVILGLLGDYETVITDYEYRNATGNVQHSIDVSPDYSWICGCGVFAIVIWCFFRLVGGFLCNR